MVMEVVHEDMSEDNMQCTNHPYKNSTPGGICAFCLKEKLGKLVSSSYPSSVFPSSSSSSSSPSSRSAFNGTTTTSAAAGGGATLQIQHLACNNSQSEANDYNNNHGNYYTRKPRLPFVLTHKKKKKKDGVIINGSDSTGGRVFKRSKSTATPRRGSSSIHFLDVNYSGSDYSPNYRRGFWSFLYLSKHSTAKKNDGHFKDLNFTTSTSSTVCTTVGPSSLNPIGGSKEQKREDFVAVDENVSPTNQASFDRKVSRSRSVGCGSRSFSGDLFERISTGFGDCTLRRVESQREGKPKVHSLQRNVGNNSNGQDCIKERVKCGGIFSGFMVNSSSSSSYYIASSVEGNNVNVKTMGDLSHGRSKSWGWAFASPMRAFGKPSNGKRDNNSSTKNATPNLDAIPSLLAVSG
ncbi:hypothetical protein DH2020_020048 [Rehmannia glutinosa]|uniref:Uncharacterized protein n=1 Tax=Rehmannia glutinosa TaxID=99300 RepID=A0ABR0WJA3_REHGL